MFLINTRVKIHGLKSATGSLHNGKLGTVQSDKDPTTLRLKVLLDQEVGLDHFLNVKETNLQLSTAKPLAMGFSGISDMALANMALLGDSFDTMKGPLLMIWKWMTEGSKGNEAARKFMAHWPGCSRGALNAAATKRILLIPHLFFRYNNPIQLPPRGQKIVYSNEGNMQQAASHLIDTPIPRTSGYAFSHTKAGCFTFTHYSNSGPMSYPRLEKTLGGSKSCVSMPLDFHPFTITETCIHEKGYNGVSDTKYALLRAFVPVMGMMLSSNHGFKGTYKSEKAFCFDVFCAACATPTNDKEDNVYTRGVHGMIVESMFNIVKGYAFDKPKKRLGRFENALRSAVTGVLSVRLAINGEAWRDVLLPRNDKEATVGQAIGLVNYSWINYALGELIEARGDYNGAAAQYKIACTIIEDAIKPGGALVDFQSGRNTLTGATNKQLGLMQNSWGLALKRAGRLEEAMKAYQLSLTTDPNNDTRKNMQCCQSAMWHVPQTNPTKGQLQKEYAEDKKVTNFNICGLPSCAKTGKKSEFKVCSRCKRAKYCCVEHQKAHWKEHKVVCKRTKNQDDGT